MSFSELQKIYNRVLYALHFTRYVFVVAEESRFSTNYVQRHNTATLYYSLQSIYYSLQSIVCRLSVYQQIIFPVRLISVFYTIRVLTLKHEHFLRNFCLLISSPPLNLFKIIYLTSQLWHEEMAIVCVTTSILAMHKKCLQYGV